MLELITHIPVAVHEAYLVCFTVQLLLGFFVLQFSGHILRKCTFLDPSVRKNVFLPPNLPAV